MDASMPERFSGSIPDLYDRDLVPILFASYADDLARRLGEHAPSSVLEVAAGTGAVTRALARSLDAAVAITATDLDRPMLDRAAAVGTARPVTWAEADAMSLPFEDGAFDAVVCQFGMMFVPDKGRAFAEMRRVLETGGVLIVSVWSSIGDNGFADAVQEGLARRFPDDPPRFLPAGAYGYHDEALIRADLDAGGWSAVASFETVDFDSRGPSAEAVATAMCHGGPLRMEIEARDADGLDAATAAAAAVLRERFGSDEIVAPMRAHVVTVRAPSHRGP